MSTISSLLSAATRQLQAAGITSAALDAEILLSHAIKKTKEFIYSHPEYQLTEKQIFNFQFSIFNRLKGVPIAYLTGHKEFFGRDFYVDKNVLIPRPETETLIEEILNLLPTSYKLQATLSDIGTGSGCIAVTLAKLFPRAKIYAVDINPKALAVAKTNARRHGVSKQITFKHGNLLKPLAKIKLDIIAANLPYLTSAEYQKEKSIKFEPKKALIAGKDGLKDFKFFFQQLALRQQKPKHIFLEIGYNQAKPLKKLSKKYLPQYQFEIRKDLAKRDRVMILTLI